MAKVRLSGGEDERALPKVGRKWGRLLVYKSYYGWIVRTVSDQVSPAQRRVISGWAGWLRWMNIIWKYLAPDLKLEFLRLEKISGVPARDLFSSSMNGLLWYFELDGGRRIYSMAHRERISRSLDVFSQVPGSMLVRGAEVWEELLPGPEGYVLRISDGVPKWMPGGGGGLSSFFFTCRQLDGSWGWSGIGGEGFFLVTLNQDSYHFVRAPLPNITGNIRVVFSFSAGFFPNVSGDVLMRGIVYGRKRESLEELARADAIFTVELGHYPAYNWQFGVDVSVGSDVLFLVVELARVGQDPRDTCNGNLYLFWLNIAIL